jgi:hypothetical protein
MSFGYFQPKIRPNYPLRARNSLLRSKQRKKQMKTRRPSAIRSIAHRNMLDQRVEKQREVMISRMEKKEMKVQTFCDHKIFPTLVGGLGGDVYDDLQETVVEISNRSPNLARSITRGNYNHSLCTDELNMPKTKLKLSRNELISSVLPGIDYLLRFKRAAFEKAHCPLPNEYIPSTNLYDVGKASKPYSTSASTDVESLRTEKQKHGRGWMADPYVDSNPNGVATYGNNRTSSINFRNHQPLPSYKKNFTIKSSVSAKELINRKEFMNLSSFG